MLIFLIYLQDENKSQKGLAELYEVSIFWCVTIVIQECHSCSFVLSFFLG